MKNYLEILTPSIALAILAAGWMVVQLLAKKTGTKNHIDNPGSCCGGCERKEECDNPEKLFPHKKNVSEAASKQLQPNVTGSQQASYRHLQ
jgi:hypothetical protein